MYSIIILAGGEMIPQTFMQKTFWPGLAVFAMGVAPAIVTAQSQSIDLHQARQYFARFRETAGS